MSVTFQKRQQNLIACLSGEIDHHLAGDMRQSLDDAILREKPQALLLDFSDVTFMDSSGIGLVMGRYRLLSQSGGELEVTGTSPQIRKVMKLAGLDRLARIG